MLIGHQVGDNSRNDDKSSNFRCDCPIHGAPEGYLSGAVGAAGAADPSSGASQGSAACRDVPGRRAVQLLHGACEPDPGEWPAADAGDGGGDYRSLLECDGAVVASGTAPT